MERLHGNQPSLTWDPSRAVPSDLPRAVMSDCPPHPSGPAGDSSSLTRPLRAAGRCQRGHSRKRPSLCSPALGPLVAWSKVAASRLGTAHSGPRTSLGDLGATLLSHPGRHTEKQGLGGAGSGPHLCPPPPARERTTCLLSLLRGISCPWAGGGDD